MRSCDMSCDASQPKSSFAQQKFAIAEYQSKDFWANDYNDCRTNCTQIMVSAAVRYEGILIFNLTVYVRLRRQVDSVRTADSCGP